MKEDKMKKVHAVVEESEDIVICVMDSIEKAEEVMDKIKSDVGICIKPFNVIINTDEKCLFVIYEECMDEQCYEKFILKIVQKKSDFTNKLTECGLTQYDIVFEEFTLNDVSLLFEGKYQHFLKEPPKRNDNPFVDNDYIAYIKEMRKQYQY